MKIKEPIIKNAKKQELFSTNENDYQDYLIETNLHPPTKYQEKKVQTNSKNFAIDTISRTKTE